MAKILESTEIKLEVIPTSISVPELVILDRLHTLEGLALVILQMMAQEASLFTVKDQFSNLLSETVCRERQLALIWKSWLENQSLEMM